MKVSKGEIAWILRAGPPQKPKADNGKRSSSDDSLRPRVAYVDG